VFFSVFFLPDFTSVILLDLLGAFLQLCLLTLWFSYYFVLSAFPPWYPDFISRVQVISLRYQKYLV
jgi:hypothetical protein